MANGNGNGSQFHWRAVDWLIRFMVPVIAGLVLILLGMVLDSSRQLAAMHERVTNIERTMRVQPPADYRTYIDSKFSEVNRRLDEMQESINTHILRSP